MSMQLHSGGKLSNAAVKYQTSQRLNALPVFDGNQKKFNNFLQAVSLYTSLNAHIFNTNELKIGFTCKAAGFTIALKGH